MDAARFEDRHPLLDPQQRLGRLNLREQEAGPAAVAGACGEQFAKGGAGRRRHAPALAQPAGEAMMFSRSGACGDGSDGDQRQTSCHTTHNALFYFCSYPVSPEQESMVRLEGEWVSLKFQAARESCESSSMSSS